MRNGKSARSARSAALPQTPVLEVGAAAMNFEMGVASRRPECASFVETLDGRGALAAAELRVANKTLNRR